MAWQVVLVCRTDDVDGLSGLMWAHQTLGVEEREAPATGDGFSPRVELRAAFSHRVAADEALAEVEASFPSWIVEMPDDTGLDAWRPYAKIERAGTFAVRPTWIDAEFPNGSIGIAIDPIRTFGSGSHASTRLALSALERFVTPGDSVLDVGTGSGILSIAAAKLGAVTALGIDVDEASPEVVKDNAKRNGVAARVAALNVPIGAVDGQMSVVVANILAPVLCDLAPDLVRRVAPTGVLILAGFLNEQEDEVLRFFPEMAIIDRVEEAGWSCVVLGHRDDGRACATPAMRPEPVPVAAPRWSRAASG